MQHFCSERYEASSRRWVGHQISFAKLRLADYGITQTGMLLLKLVQKFTETQQQLCGLPLSTKLSIGKILESTNELLKRLATMLIYIGIKLGSPYESFCSGASSPVAKALSSLPSQLLSSQLATEVENTLGDQDSNPEM